MSLVIKFLGTSAARPTVERGVSSLALIREGETLLFDCGEGTQRQMMRYGVSFALDEIFFSHFHVDHFLGVVGLLRTLALQGRTAAMRCYGPRGAEKFLRKCETLGSDRLTFRLDIIELDAGDELKRVDYRLVTAPAEHRGAVAVSWGLIEDERRGRFDPDKARALGIPEGPLWGRIHRGDSVTLENGSTILASELVGPTRPARRVVISGDTRPCHATRELATGADLLVHESTFGDDDAARAIETGHSTAREAAQLALDAGVKRLALTHLSARYSRDPSDLEREARSVFPTAVIARDGMEIDVPFESEALAPDPATLGYETI